jgi:hypothetical protein
MRRVRRMRISDVEAGQTHPGAGMSEIYEDFSQASVRFGQPGLAEA